MAEIEIVSVDFDEFDLDDDTRALLESCLPDEPVDLRAILTEGKIAEAMISADIVKVH